LLSSSSCCLESEATTSLNSMASVGAVSCDEKRKKPYYKTDMRSSLETRLAWAKKEAGRRADKLKEDAVFWGSERGQQKIARQRGVASESEEAKAEADRAAAEATKEADFWESDAGFREVALQMQKNTVKDFWAARKKPKEDWETSSQCTVSTSQSTVCTLSPEAEEEVQRVVDADRDVKRLAKKLREMIQLEASNSLDKLQKEKLQKKPEVERELQLARTRVALQCRTYLMRSPPSGEA